MTPRRTTGRAGSRAGTRSRDGLEHGGIDGFIAASVRPDVPESWQETVVKVTRQRLSQHEHLDAVADALRAVPRSRPFGSIDELAAIAVPVAVVASADEPDPGHPQAVGEAYAAAIPGARLVLDEPGRSPIAWQGSQLSKLIAEVAAEARGAMNATQPAGYSGTPLAAQARDQAGGAIGADRRS